MATKAELRKNYLMAELHSVDQARGKYVAEINNWFQWAQNLPPIVSTPVQILDIGYPVRAERDQWRNMKYIGEVVRELSEVIPQVPGTYEVGGVTFHPHAEVNESKFTSSTLLKVGGVFVPVDFAPNNVVIDPAHADKTTLEIKEDQTGFFKSRFGPQVEVCQEHELRKTVLWTPDMKEEGPTPLMPIFDDGIWVNIGALDPFSRMVIAKDERNKEARAIGRYDVDSPFLVDNYRTVKKLGVFEVHNNVSQDNWSQSELNFNLGIGDKFLEFHLPYEEQYKGAYDRKAFFGSVVESFHLIAAYIKKHNLDVKYVMGSTDERLARGGRISGFEVKPIPMKEELKAGYEELVLKYNPRFQPENQPGGKDPKPFGDILLVYQPTDQFLARFGDK